jgi:nicotinamidase-related amidase
MSNQRKPKKRRSRRNFKYKRSKKLSKRRSKRSFKFGGGTINWKNTVPKTQEYITELKSLMGYSNTKVNVNSDSLLFVIDMQYDFIDDPFINGKTWGNDGMSVTASGTFAAIDSGEIVLPASETVGKFISKNCTIIASKDYHTPTHASFTTRGGPYPPHCMMGTNGAKVIWPIYKQLRSYPKGYIAYKGFDNNVDSYSALRYTNSYKDNAVVGCEPGGGCGNIWTGSYLLKTKTGGYFKFGNNGNELEVAEGYQNLNDNQYNPISDNFNYPKGCSNQLGFPKQQPSTCNLTYIGDSEIMTENTTSDIFIIGLVGGICVLDTARVAREMYPTRNIYIIFDLTRMVWLPDNSPAPTGFYLKSPEEYSELLKENNIQVIYTNDLVFN